MRDPTGIYSGQFGDGLDDLGCGGLLSRLPARDGGRREWCGPPQAFRDQLTKLDKCHAPPELIAELEMRKKDALTDRGFHHRICSIRSFCGSKLDFFPESGKDFPEPS